MCGAPEAGGGQAEHLAELATRVRGLIGLRDQLEAHSVTRLAMEANGVYWPPVGHVLEHACELFLVNARHVKQVPERKTDVSDAAWLSRLMEAGLLRPGFVPPSPGAFALAAAGGRPVGAGNRGRRQP